MSDDTSLSSTQFAQRIGITYRQLNYWCEGGVFGAEQQDHGSGIPRRFPVDLIEAGMAAKDLAHFWHSLGGRHGLVATQVLAAVVRVVAARPVGYNERLAVLADGTVLRRAPVHMVTAGARLEIPLRRHEQLEEVAG